MTATGIPITVIASPAISMALSGSSKGWANKPARKDLPNESDTVSDTTSSCRGMKKFRPKPMQASATKKPTSVAMFCPIASKPEAWPRPVRIGLLAARGAARGRDGVRPRLLTERTLPPTYPPARVTVPFSEMTSPSTRPPEWRMTSPFRAARFPSTVPYTETSPESTARFPLKTCPRRMVRSPMCTWPFSTRIPMLPRSSP